MQLPAATTPPVRVGPLRTADLHWRGKVSADEQNSVPDPWRGFETVAFPGTVRRARRIGWSSEDVYVADRAPEASGMTVELRRTLVRSRPDEAAPSACSTAGPICGQPSQVVYRTPRSWRKASTASGAGIAGSGRRPAARSSRTQATVSLASPLVCPIRPIGPRLIQPVT
ncbi:hypothetical protein SBADM41S_00640 [Streptomyces badius]